ncbi:ThiF family adenylyltransferase [Lutimonas sp.]|jgi:adenylyltransferase/sulfurtransferase|uniref:ThiF family adenylyltransferase n=1 Tax=Lutimonas sp. TaxID=1872403 RepID=UPI003C7431AF
MNTDKEKTFIRQTTLPEIGEIGQEKINNSRIAIIGCGGLGSVAAVYLAASGVGHIHLIDYDTIDLSNLHRQVFYRRDQVGKSKAKILAAYIKEISTYVEVSFTEEPITKSNIHETLNVFSLIVDCTDSLATKYLLNDYCVLQHKTLVYGSLYKHDGYVSVFNAISKGDRGAHLRDAFPSMPQKHVPNCSEIGTLNPIVGIIGLMQANEVIKIITETGKPLMNKVLIYNSMENTQFLMKLQPTFPLKEVETIFNDNEYFDARCQVQDPSLLIDADELKKSIHDKNLKIISVIENQSVSLPFPVHLRMPISSLDPSKLESFTEDKIVVICQKGISSYTATEEIKKKFPHLMVYSLKNGIDQY